MTNFMSELLHECINYLGEYSPFLLFFISLFLLRDKGNLFYYYIYGIIANSIINAILKIIIREPRPSIGEKDFKLASKNGFHFYNYDKYLGMPSAHSQNVFYSTFFVFFALKKYNILLLYLFISFITVYQRVYFNYHTVSQVFVGGIIGIIIAYATFYTAKIKIKGKLKNRKEENAPMYHNL
jgi:membrane-associated phospholipid phosphatase